MRVTKRKREIEIGIGKGGGERKKKKKNKYRREGHIQSFLAQHRDPSARRCVNNCFILL